MVNFDARVEEEGVVRGEARRLGATLEANSCLFPSAKLLIREREIPNEIVRGWGEYDSTQYR